MTTQNDINLIRHSMAHIMAAAVAKIWPGSRFGVGPVIDNGFYYDIAISEHKLKEEDLEKIKNEMINLIEADHLFIRNELTVDDAIKKFEALGQDFKVSLLADLKKKGTTKLDETEAEIIPKGASKVSIYETADFSDLCRGPHIKSSGELKNISFKLNKISGAYWRGNEHNPMLTRIYGVAFEQENQLKKYLAMLAEAEKRDHRKLGKELDLFTFSDLVGSGLPLYTPNGAFIRRSINDYVENMQSAQGYTQVWTPQIAKGKLFQISGHYDKYKDSMFRAVSNYSKEEFFLKPMNCPQHTQIYQSQARSYRDLPLRYTDFAMLYRDEKPGELNGLARVRSFSQDDCHIFCREDQVDEEIDRSLAMIKEILAAFGFKYRYRLSTRDPKHPEKYLGDPKIWAKVEKWAEKIMQRNRIDHFDGPGEAAFYAPKMDLLATDALGREWQLSTIQIDYVMPERFNLEYTDNTGRKKRPVMIHRAILGSPERFLMILIEHFAGAFPLWLSPLQISIITVAESHIEYAARLAEELKSHNLRVRLNSENETVGNKIRKAIAAKIPYILVIGDKETNSGDLHLRARGQKNLLVLNKKEFIEHTAKLIKDKSLNL